MFDPEEIRKDFPILSRQVNGKDLVYLDSTATSQKPRSVIEAVSRYYENHNANVHRGAHTLGDEATDLHEKAREDVARFIGASSPKEIVFVRNTTEALNLLSHSWGLSNLSEGDVVVLSEMEHHANVVPWQEVCRQTASEIRYVDVTSQGELDMEDYKSKVKGAKIVSLAHVSNVLGTINPVSQIVKIAKKEGALVSLDGAQAVPHMRVDVSEIGCDFYSFSGHKMLAPMGIGVFWGRRELLEEMPPYMTGGGMISAVYKDRSSFAELPEKFEAGTPDVSSAVGLSAAISYLDRLGMDNVREHDKKMGQYSHKKMSEVSGVTILGPSDPEKRSGSLSFTYEGGHSHDVATILDSEGVAVRSGHHCAMILHDKLGIISSSRASWNVYSMTSEIDRLVEALSKVKEILG